MFTSPKNSTATSWFADSQDLQGDAEPYRNHRLLLALWDDFEGDVVADVQGVAAGGF